MNQKFLLSLIFLCLGVLSPCLAQDEPEEEPDPAPTEDADTSAAGVGGGGFGGNFFLSPFMDEEAFGVDIRYGQGQFSFDPPPDDAPDNVKGYTELLKANNPFEENVISVGLSFGTWGFNYSLDDGEKKINDFADTSQTPDNLTDDNYVFSVKRSNRSLSLFYQPLPFMTIGYGQDNHSLSFEQRLPEGVNNTKSFSNKNNYISLALAFGFDLTGTGIAPIVTFFTKFPSPLPLPILGETQNFRGSSNGLGLGVFWGF